MMSLLLPPPPPPPPLFVMRHSYRNIRVSMWYDHKTTVEAFSFLRFIHAQGSEVMILPQIGFKYDWVKNPIRPISIQNEVQVLKTLAVKFEDQLATYERSMEVRGRACRYVCMRRSTWIGSDTHCSLAGGRCGH